MEALATAFGRDNYTVKDVHIPTCLRCSLRFFEVCFVWKLKKSKLSAYYNVTFQTQCFKVPCCRRLKTCPCNMLPFSVHVYIDHFWWVARRTFWTWHFRWSILVSCMASRDYRADYWRFYPFQYSIMYSHWATDSSMQTMAIVLHLVSWFSQFSSDSFLVITFLHPLNVYRVSRERERNQINGELLASLSQ